MKTLVCVAFVTLTCFVSPTTILAQASSASAFLSPWRVEFRVGSAIPPDTGPDGGGNAIGGGLIAIPLGKSGPWRLFSAQFAADNAELGRTIFVDPVFGRAASTEQLILLTPRLGITAMRTSRFIVDTYIGGGWLITNTSFALESTPDTNAGVNPAFPAGGGGDDFENVCDLTLFTDRCGNIYEGVFTVGLGFRVRRKPDGHLFLGADYGWYSIDRHQIVGTVGFLWQ
ncbi:MAG TPA: hypothetical protein VM818_22750 [Vicinamibacterales bacterium]|nr:hypothetical protein [Vicinamibacterales bacterium]